MNRLQIYSLVVFISKYIANYKPEVYREVINLRCGFVENV